MHRCRRDMERVGSRLLWQRNVSHQRLCQIADIGTLSKQRNSRQGCEAIRCGLGVSRLALLNHRPRCVEVETPPFVPPLASNLLMCRANQISTRPCCQVVRHSGLDVNCWFHRLNFIANRRPPQQTENSFRFQRRARIGWNALTLWAGRATRPVRSRGYFPFFPNRSMAALLNVGWISPPSALAYPACCTR